MFPVLGEHVWAERNDLEPVGAGVLDHVLDQGHRRARAAHARRRFGVVGADQPGTANGENEFGFAVDAVDPADIAAARAGSVVPLPELIPDEIGAQLLINTATAVTAIRTAHNSVPPNARPGVVVLLTAAGSAVGRLLGKLLTDRGVKVIRLVRSEAGAEKLTRLPPESPIFATDTAGWKDRARAATEGLNIHVAIDSVGGALLGDVADLLAEGTGTVVNFGSLGGETSDIRLFAPRSLTLKGVSLGQWTQQPVADP